MRNKLWKFSYRTSSSCVLIIFIKLPFSALKESCCPELDASASSVFSNFGSNPSAKTFFNVFSESFRKFILSHVSLRAASTWLTYSASWYCCPRLPTTLFKTLFWKIFFILILYNRAFWHKAMKTNICSPARDLKICCRFYLYFIHFIKGAILEL